MDRETLERLAANPHYKMTQAQIAELSRLRSHDIQPDQRPPKHDPTFSKHDPKLKKTPYGNTN